MQRKFKVFIFASILIFFLLILRIFSLQIIKGDYYFRLSDNNRIRVLRLHAPRGLIHDRNGELLVENEPSYTVSVLPFEFEPTQENILAVARLVDMPPESISAKVETRKVNDYTPIPIKRRVPLRLVHRLGEQSADFPGVVYEVEPMRLYPYNELACHIIGYTGEISAPELREMYKLGRRAGDIVGKQGVEKIYDSKLRGRDGASYLEVRANGEVIGPARDKQEIPPIAGAELFLTIDLWTQAMAESVFAWVEKGVLIAMDPTTGEILASVSKPNFDLNIFSAPVSSGTWEKLSDRKTHPMFNRVTQGNYPPASTIKLVTGAIALQERIINKHSFQEQPCTGSIWYGDREFFCWLRRGHGALDFLDAMATSCDVYFYQLGMKIGLDTWTDYMRRCHFGEKTEIELAPEATGFIPTRNFYNDRFGPRGWGRGVILNLCIGQGEILVTPLQMAIVVSAFANGGKLLKPKIVKRLVPPDGATVEFPTVVRDELPFDREVMEDVIEGMVRVVNSDIGTGKAAAIPGITVAGKTGTAQNPTGENHAWFVGFAPVDDPKIVVVVLLEHGGSGSLAAWVAGEFLRRYFLKGADGTL